MVGRSRLQSFGNLFLILLTFFCVITFQQHANARPLNTKKVAVTRSSNVINVPRMLEVKESGGPSPGQGHNHGPAAP